MCLALVDQPRLKGAVTVGCPLLVFVRVQRVEPGAPAAVPDSVVPFGDSCEILPGIGTQRLDRVLAHTNSCSARTRRSASIMTHSRGDCGRSASGSAAPLAADGTATQDGLAA